MHFFKTITIAALAVGAFALPQVPAASAAPGAPAAAGKPNIPAPGPANDLLRTIKNDLLILDRAVTSGTKSINAALKTSQDSASAEVNAKINANIAAIQQAALSAGYGVEGDTADAAKEITAPEARALKGDAQLLTNIASDLADIIKRTEASEVSATNTELAAQKSALIGALESVAHPVVQYIGTTKSAGSAGSDEAVADLKATVVGLVSNMKVAFGIS